jgi:hypothetical protein
MGHRGIGTYKVRVMLGKRNVPLSTPSPRISRQIRTYTVSSNSNIGIRVITRPNHITFHRRVRYLGCARTSSLYMSVFMDKLLKAMLRINDRYVGLEKLYDENQGNQSSTAAPDRSDR